MYPAVFCILVGLVFNVFAIAQKTSVDKFLYVSFAIFFYSIAGIFVRMTPL